MSPGRQAPTLSTAPHGHRALDYAALRAAGLRHLERLAGHLWTDFNDHDPGITILEQLCYALTDVAYRAARRISTPRRRSSARGPSPCSTCASS